MMWTRFITTLIFGTGVRGGSNDGLLGGLQESCSDFCGIRWKPICAKDGNTYDNECLLRCERAIKACNGKCPCPSPISTEWMRLLSTQPLSITRWSPVNTLQSQMTPDNMLLRQVLQSNLNQMSTSTLSNVLPWTPMGIRMQAENPTTTSGLQINPLINAMFMGNRLSGGNNNWFLGNCNCGNDYDPVCTLDYQTYNNKCRADCDRKIVLCDGQCPCTAS